MRAYSALNRKRQRETDQMESRHFCLLHDELIAIQVAEYLDPPSRLNLMKVNDDFSRHLSCFYCTKHGSMISTEGFGISDVQDHIERDGHDVLIFREKLGLRTEKVDPEDWYTRTVPCEYKGIVPLDFDPVYKKYLSMLKECEQCETEATDVAMAGIGLHRCSTCEIYWDKKHVYRPCEECNSLRCNDCDFPEECSVCGYCSKCFEFDSCDVCDIRRCVNCVEINKCIGCNFQGCRDCYEDNQFHKCDYCYEYFCNRHGYCCGECDVDFCMYCKDRDIICNHHFPFSDSEDDDSNV